MRIRVIHANTPSRLTAGTRSITSPERPATRHKLHGWGRGSAALVRHQPAAGVIASVDRAPRIERSEMTCDTPSSVADTP